MLRISRKDHSSVSLVGGKDLPITPRTLLSTTSFPGRIVCLRYNTMLAKKQHFENFNATPAFGCLISRVRTYPKCPVTSFEYRMMSSR